jgi:hypothetical protein
VTSRLAEQEIHTFDHAERNVTPSLLNNTVGVAGLELMYMVVHVTLILLLYL